MHRGGTLQEPEIRLYNYPEVSLLRLFPGGRSFQFIGRAVFLDNINRNTVIASASEAIFCGYRKLC